MLHGGFSGISKRPYLEGKLAIPGLAPPSSILFCVDTGADGTTLLPADSIRMGIDFEALHGEAAEAIGLGGSVRGITIPAMVTFNEQGVAIYVYNIDLTIVAPEGNNEDLPSLLGRDVLNRWRMRYSPPTNRLTFSVLEADHAYPLTTPT